MNRLQTLWFSIRDSFWFVPGLIIACSIAIALFFIEMDSYAKWEWIDDYPRFFGVQPQGARDMLATIASSMMTVVGVTFSITLMTLTLAASQYTSRILRNFMGDRVTQVVLGVFAGIYIYCLIVLRTVRGGDESVVPSVSVAFSILLAIGGVVALIFFIHHIALSIQASSIIAAVARETTRAVDRLFPEPIGRETALKSHAKELEGLSPPPGPGWISVPAPKTGYIQGVDDDGLIKLASEHICVIHMAAGIGHFVIKDTNLAWINADADPSRKTIDALQAAYSIGRYRTVDQDAEFGLRQIVDIALRALSPSTNDTTTAVMCADHLTAILVRLASRSIPARERYVDGKLRLIAVGPDFTEMVAGSFHQIRESAEGNAAMLLALVDSIAKIAAEVTSVERKLVLRRELDAIEEAASRTIQAPDDRAQIERHLAAAREVLANPR